VALPCLLDAQSELLHHRAVTFALHANPVCELDSRDRQRSKVIRLGESLPDIGHVDFRAKAWNAVGLHEQVNNEKESRTILKHVDAALRAGSSNERHSSRAKEQP